jgi:hypothetical protein
VVGRTPILALVVLGGIVAWTARASQRVPEAVSTATPNTPTSTPAAVSALAKASEQHFDIEEDPAFKSGFPLRPLDRDIFAAMRDPNLDRTRLTDLFPGRPERVRLLGSVAERNFAQVLVDRDRDGTWDERWALKPNEVSRVVPNDPSTGGSVRYTLSHGRWQAH